MTFNYVVLRCKVWDLDCRRWIVTDWFLSVRPTGERDFEGRCESDFNKSRKEAD